MKLHYYVVSLKGAEQKYEGVRRALINIGVSKHRINRYEGVDGRKRKTREKGEQTFPEVKLVTNAVFGCASSQINLMKELSRKYRDYSEAVPVVLEDDARPVVDSESIINEKVQQAIDEHSDWDVLRLHCTGICDRISEEEEFPLLSVWSGSNLAYVPSIKGMKKISSIRPNLHIDVKYAFVLTERTPKKPLFEEATTAATTSTTSGKSIIGLNYKKLLGERKVGDLELYRYFEYGSLREPMSGTEIISGDILLICVMVVFLVIIIFSLYRRYHLV